MKTNYHWLPDRIKTSSKNKWQVKEPKDRTDPVDHERFVKTRLNNRGLLIGASVRGKNHAHRGLWRDDAFHFDQAGAFTIMAVADGAGSYALSRVGARIACDTSVSFAKNYLDQHGLTALSDISESVKPSVEECLENSVLNAILSLEEEARKRQIHADLLSTTLILLLHARTGQNHLIASLQVGDGAAALRRSSGEVIILGKPDHGEYAGQSLFLTSPGIKEEIGSRVNRVTIEDLKCLATMTDGIADDYFPLEKALKIFFDQAERSILKRFRPLRKLKKWIQYEKVGSYDDRTLLLLSFR